MAGTLDVPDDLRGRDQSSSGLSPWYWSRGTGAVVLEPGLLGVLGLIL